MRFLVIVGRGVYAIAIEVFLKLFGNDKWESARVAGESDVYFGEKAVYMRVSH